MKNRKKNWFFNELFGTDFDEFLWGGKDFNDLESRTDGKLEITTGSDENGSWEKQLWTSDDGSHTISSFVRTSNGFNPQSKESKKMKISDLKKQLKAAVDSEDYRTATKLKEELDSLGD